jgi:hypothetical protein
MRHYWRLIAALSVVTAIMAVHNLATLVLMLTLGLAAPLVASGTVLLYALCGFPLASSWRAGSRGRIRGAVLTAILAVGVAVMPRFVAQLHAEAQSREFRGADHRPSGSAHAATIEIQRPSQSFDDMFADQEACGAECRGLLLQGSVRWIRIVMTDVRTPGRSVVYRALHGSECAVPGSTTSESATCIVIVSDTGETAELSIEIQAPPRGNSRAFGLGVLRGTRVVTARLSQASQEDEILRQTEVTFELPTVPTLIGPHFLGLDSGGIGIERRTTRIDPITLASVIAQLGYTVAPLASAAPPSPGAKDWMRSIDDNMTREMLEVLALPQTAPFNSLQMKPVNEWIAHARNIKTWTADLIALLRRIVRDPRIRSATNFDQIFERNSDVATALMPDVLDVIDSAGIDRDYTPARQAAYTFSRLDPNILKPHTDRIVALLNHGRDVKAILLPSIGLLDVNPLPYLVPFEADRTAPSPYSINPRVTGACLADKKWAPELIGPLRELFKTWLATKPNDTEYLKLTLTALESLGDHDFVMQQLYVDGTNQRLRLRLASGPENKESRYRMCLVF